MQSCFKIDLILIKLSNVKFLCLKARVFLVSVMKWRISGQRYEHLTRFVLFKLATSTMQKINSVDCFNLCHGRFVYIFEENHQNRISTAGEKISPTISFFFRGMIA